jgi:uncharacterized membrane protein YphA (DoxX/SURF4 family)
MKISFPDSFGEWLILIIRLVVGGVFIYASIDKIINPGEFAKVIHNYRLLPPELINISAVILPWIEFTAGVSLFLGINYRGANMIILLLLIVFTIALGINFVRGVNISCGCFSTSSTVKSNLLMRIIEDLLLMLGCILIALKHKIIRPSSSVT